MAASLLPKTTAMLTSGFTVGWICALDIELTAARAALNEEWSESLQDIDEQDENRYVIGRIGNHNVAIACLPAGQYGTTSAATVAKDMLRTFKQLRLTFMVGIGGGVPTDDNDMRLGDVVVSIPDKTYGGVIQYEMGKSTEDAFIRKGNLCSPSRRLLSIVQTLRAETSTNSERLADMHSLLNDRLSIVDAGFQMPASASDTLVREGQRVIRPYRTYDHPKIHYGLIGSGNRVIANETERDQLHNNDGIICFEMEAAGLMNSFQCLVVRGISDYADSRKNDHWQKYAAASAAAYTAFLLAYAPFQQSVPGRAELQRDSHAMLNTVIPAQSVQNSKKIANDPAAETPVVFCHAPAVKTFVGRTAELADMKTFFAERKATSGPVICVVSGLGGIGKTQLCLEFCRKHAGHFDYVIWIDGSSHTTVKQSFQNFRVQHTGLLDVDPRDISATPFTDGDDSAQILRWLSTKKRWLLVFDNVDLDHRATSPDSEAFDVESFIPASREGSVLITTRLQSLNSMGKPLRIEPMNQAEARQVVEQNLGGASKDDSGMQGVLTRLKGLPLALSLAGSLLRDSNMSLETYNRHYDRNWHALIEMQDKYGMREYIHPMRTTWITSLQQMEVDNPAAADLLRIWSFCSPTKFSFTLLKDVQMVDIGSSDSTGSRTLQPPPKRFTFSELDFLGAMRTVLRFSLASKTSEQETYALHPLIHSWAFDLVLQDADRELSLKCCAVAAAVIGSEVARETVHKNHWQALKALLSHANQLSDRIEQSIEAERNDMAQAMADENVASLLCQLGRPEKAETILRQLLRRKEALFGPNAPSTIQTAHSLGEVLAKQKKYEESLTMYERALQSGLHDHPYDLRAPVLATGLKPSSQELGALEGMSNLYSTKGQHEQARNIIDLALDTRKALGANYSSMLDTLSHRADLAIRRGDNPHYILDLEVQVLEGRQASLGPNHVKTIQSLWRVGQHQRKLRMPTAITLLKAAFDGIAANGGLSDEDALTLSVAYMDACFDHRDLNEALRASCHILANLKPSDNVPPGALQVVHKDFIKAFQRQTVEGLEKSTGPDKHNGQEIRGCIAFAKTMIDKVEAIVGPEAHRDDFWAFASTLLDIAIGEKPYEWVQYLTTSGGGATLISKMDASETMGDAVAFFERLYETTQKDQQELLAKESTTILILIARKSLFANDLNTANHILEQIILGEDNNPASDDALTLIQGGETSKAWLMLANEVLKATMHDKGGMFFWLANEKQDLYLVCEDVGQQLIEAGELEEAEALLEAACRCMTEPYEEGSFPLIVLLACVYRETGEYDGAREALNNVLLTEESASGDAESRKMNQTIREKALSELRKLDEAEKKIDEPEVEELEETESENKRPDTASGTLDRPHDWWQAFTPLGT